MQTRNKRTQMSYKEFVDELQRIVEQIDDTYGTAQLLYIKELYTVIYKNIVNVYMSQVHDFPEKYAKFAHLISIIHYKSEEFLRNIKMEDGKRTGVFDAIYNARAQIYEIAEPVINGTSPLVNGTSPSVNGTCPSVNGTSPSVNVPEACREVV